LAAVGAQDEVFVVTVGQELLVRGSDEGGGGPVIINNPANAQYSDLRDYSGDVTVRFHANRVVA